jgi:hypothetical protein
VLERRDDGMSYARVAPGRLRERSRSNARQKPPLRRRGVTVRYDVTSLGRDGVGFVEELESAYDAFLADWRREILAGLKVSARPRQVLDESRQQPRVGCGLSQRTLTALAASRSG